MKINEKFGGYGFACKPPQILLIMKITFIIMTVFLLQVSASTKAQITLQENGTPLRKVLERISKQSGYDLVYSSMDFKLAKPVTVTLNNVSVEKALLASFEGQPLIYEISEKTVMVKKREAAGVLDIVGVQLRTIDVRGRVVDEKGEPLIGASVSVKGGRGTTTDKAGRFYMVKVDEKAILVVSFIGYLMKEVNANADLSNVALEVSNSKLDEVQVIAYGTTNRRLSTGNVVSIKSSEIEKQPVNNPLLALAAIVPGLQVSQSSGLPGSGVTVRIQGQNSINNGNDPFYVIDGVPYLSQRLPNLGTILGDSGGKSLNGGVSYGNPFSFINPADIESIDILKDADATSIYGSRAANGAIIITTKRGKSGRTKIDLNLQSGLGEVANKVNLLNTKQYLEMRNEALKNDLIKTPSSADYDINGLWDLDRYTDWQEELIGKRSRYNDVQLSISGGSQSIQFLVGAGYHKETTVFPGDFSDRKSSIHFTVNHQSDDQKFNAQFSGSYLVDNNHLMQTDLTAYAMQMAPNAPAISNADGTLNWMPNSSGSSSWYNPLAFTLNTYSDNTKNLISNTLLNYKLTSDLEIKTTFGYTNMQSIENSQYPLQSISPENRPYESRVAGYGNTNLDTWIVEPQLNYQRRIGQGKFEILVGTTFQQSNSHRTQFFGSGYNSDLVLGDIKSAANLTVENSIDLKYKYNALFSRVNYNLRDKYIFNLTARRDGSSRFGSENQFHNFGSVAGAWILSNESFLKSKIASLSFAKLKASYGTTGSDQIGDYTFMNLYNVTMTDGATYQNSVGLEANGLQNPYLQWEETRKLQIGVDLGFWSDRVLLSTNYYRNRSANQLLGYTLPSATGFTTILLNFPAVVRNSGFEFLLNTTNVKSNSFSWYSAFNLSIPQNKLLSFDNIESSSAYNTLIMGQSITSEKYFKSAGVNSTTGFYQFLTSTSEITSSPDPTIDKTVVLDKAPKFYGGFQNSISYKAFSLSFSLQFVKQLGTFNFYGNSRPGRFNTNQPETVLGRWQVDNTNNPVQRFGTRFNLFSPYINILQSNASVMDASFIRLKNVSFNWQIPKVLANKMHFQSSKLFIQGQNLFTLTSYKGLDPETRSSNTLPPLRVITLGIQASF